MNKFKPMNQPARGQVTRAMLLGLLVASCGCAQTLENNRLGRATRQLPSGQPARTQDRHASLPTQALAQGSPASTSRARISDAPLASPVQPQSSVVPVSFDQPTTILADESSATEPNCVNPQQVPCADQSACVPCAPPGACGPMMEPVQQYWNDQEYLVDGGDREPAVQVTPDWKVLGLDSQDTIAHYETLEGKLCVTPSNRVPIYAPRFGAVRKITSPTLSAGAVGARGMLDPRGPGVKASHEPVGDLALPQGPRRRDAIAPIDSLRERTRGVEAEKILPPTDLGSYQMALRRLQNLGPVVRREDLRDIVGQYIVNAATWASPEGLSVAISGVAAVQVSDAKEVQDVTVYETEPGQCSLRIYKAASHSAANPGDIINFSIRFENIGNKPIGNLVILDSLVSRLEYIDGSQQCVLSLASNKTPDEKNVVKFSTAENEAGSTVLRWEADLPLETSDSGVITFRCRVR